MNVAAAWLRSGETASLDGIEVVPLPYPGVASMPIAISRGQAVAYVLEDRQRRGWILKKFQPGHDPEISYVRAIRALVPQETGFESGSQRRILSARAVGGGYATREFTEWIDNTILMPRARGLDWLDLSDSIRDGTRVLGEQERVAMCQSLVGRVRALERTGLSHRDLSITNVFIDPATWSVHLIDWDSLYHPSLALPSNSTVGTVGYIAPFQMTPVGGDARLSWCAYADRFAMALLCAEFLMLDVRSHFTHEGGLFDQEELCRRGGPTIQKFLPDLTSQYPAVGRLVERVLHARAFTACPSPDEWLAAPPLAISVRGPDPPRRSAVATFEQRMAALKAPPPPPPAPQLPSIDFSAVIRELLTSGSPPASGPPGRTETED